MLFGKKILIWKTYITNEILLITKQIQIINLIKFFIAALDVNSKMFMVYVAIQEQEKMLVHSKK